MRVPKPRTKKILLSQEKNLVIENLVKEIQLVVLNEKLFKNRESLYKLEILALSALQGAYTRNKVNQKRPTTLT